MGEILKVFGKRVRSLRRAKDMTQEQLAHTLTVVRRAMQAVHLLLSDLVGFHFSAPNC